MEHLSDSDNAYLDRVTESPLPPSVVCRLLERARAGDVAARESLVRSHVRLALRVVGRYRRAPQQPGGPSMADLCQVALTELNRQIDIVDIEEVRRSSFGAIVQSYMRSYVGIAYNRYHNSFVVPARVRGSLRRLRVSHGELEALGIEHPSPEQLAERSGVDVERAAEALPWLTPVNASLDEPAGEGIAEARHEFVPAAESTDLAPEFLANFTDEEAAILRLRHEGDEIRRVAGAPFGYSAARVATLERHAASIAREFDVEGSRPVSSPARAEVDAQAQATVAAERAKKVSEVAARPKKEERPERTFDFSEADVLTAFRSLTDRQSARLGLFCSVSVDRGEQAARLACGEVFGSTVRGVSDGFLQLAKKLDLGEDVSRDFREFVSPIVAGEYREIETLIASMNVRDRDLLTQRVLLGRGAPELAREAEMHPETVRQHAIRAKARLEELRSERALRGAQPVQQASPRTLAI